MTVRELKALLEDFDGDVEVRMMTQHNYPMEWSIDGAWAKEPEEVDVDELTREEEAAIQSMPDVAMDTGVLYLTEGTWIGYGDRRAWEGRRS